LESPVVKQIGSHYSLLPISDTDGCLVFGTINPENTPLKQELEFLLSREVRFVSKTEPEILAGLKNLQSPESIRDKPDRAGKRQFFLKILLM
jgi:hypothetical protein